MFPIRKRLCLYCQLQLPAFGLKHFGAQARLRAETQHFGAQARSLE